MGLSEKGGGELRKELIRFVHGRRGRGNGCLKGGEVEKAIEVRSIWFSFNSYLAYQAYKEGVQAIEGYHSDKDDR